MISPLFTNSPHTTYRRHTPHSPRPTHRRHTPHSASNSNYEQRSMSFKYEPASEPLHISVQ